MPADDVDPELLIDAMLLRVEDMGDRGTDWLQSEFNRVLDAVMAGDEYVSSTSDEGGSATSERKVPSKVLLAVLTQCRKRLDAEANGSPAAGAMLIPRFTEFPLPA